MPAVGSEAILGRRHIGCVDLVDVRMNRIFGETLLRIRETDKCPLWEAEQDRRLKEMYVKPPKWTTKPHLWDDRRIPADLAVEAAEAAARASLMGGSQVNQDADRTLRPVEDSRLPSAGSSFRARGCGGSAPRLESAAVTPSAKERATARLNQLAKAASSPTLKRSRHYNEDYGRPPPDQFYDFSSIHRRPDGVVSTRTFKPKVKALHTRADIPLATPPTRFNLTT
eukprot:TRINITY_DN31795_c0_g1_i1.p1 TRINITY_DN31795_c0_g1~~TRINITY_DN31795_c0_g1_i1.p1  ORF type:complete len:226 (+),score=36.23 TRINITY_DN31795_c0_g1_i1:107-784(+)